LNRNIKKLFDKADQQIMIKEEKKKEAITNVVYAMRIEEKRTYSRGISLLLNQSRYMDKTMLWIQLLIEGIVAFIFFGFKNIEVSRQDILPYIIICSGMIGVFLPSAIHRCFASNMAELGETCYFNTKQMVVLQTVYSGISSLVFIFLGILFIGTKWKIHLVQVSLYVLVPFVLSGCFCLGILLAKARRKKTYTFTGMGLVLGMFYITLVSIPYIYHITALVLWGISLVVGVCIFGIQMTLLVRYIDKGEILCMN